MRAASGLVVANDAHPKRVQALQATLARHGRAPRELARLVITCHRGEEMPAPARRFGDNWPDTGAQLRPLTVRQPWAAAIGHGH